jgi:hypothetical protein
MARLQDQNLKIKIQILDADDNILVSGVTSQQMIHDLEVYQGISGVDQAYRMLLDELEQKQQAEK